ncbi:hypothetical protein Tco_0820859 [Tanacetum coccineum]|uniref:Uncharacterized protein n=1 Tax=Tanacetum coccineum TaxID=301880 RepID=A0ABQ5AAL3_9ASTR
MSNSFSALNEEEEEDDEEEVENVYDESANLIQNTKAGGSLSFTAAAGMKEAVMMNSKGGNSMIWKAANALAGHHLDRDCYLIKLSWCSRDKQKSANNTNAQSKAKREWDVKNAEINYESLQESRNSRSQSAPSASVNTERSRFQCTYSVVIVEEWGFFRTDSDGTAKPKT